MKNGRKIIVAIMFIIGVIALLVGSVAYYRVVVEGSIKGTTGNAVFVLKDSDDSVWNNKVIDLGKVNPGDSGEFTVTMDATGSVVDMYATLEIERSNLPTNLKFYTTSDYKSELYKYYSLLETSNQTETLTIYWYWNPYINDEEDSKFINVSNLEANVRVNAIQIGEYAMMKNGYSSSSDANGGTEFWNNTYKSYIRTITFDNDLSDLPSSCTEENLCWDISYSSTQKKKVYGYLVDSGLTIEETDSSTSTTINKTLYNLYIVSEAPIFAPTNSSNIFSFYKLENIKKISNLIAIDFNNNFNTSKVINMSYMFNWCTSLTSLDLSNFNTSKVTDMMQMFSGCSSLTNLDLSNFNTSKVTNMSNMFYYCSSLTSLDLSNFNTSKVTDMMQMFDGCSSLTNLDLSGFNTSKVTSMGYMFYICLSLTSLDLSSFNTSNVTDMMQMFDGCSKLTTTINIMNANVTNYSSMFYAAATASGSKITVNYIADASALVDNMIATKSSDSNVVKGSQI